MENAVAKGNILLELFSFLWHKKIWWAIPVILLMVMLIGVLIFSQSTGLLPFIYPLM